LTPVTHGPAPIPIHSSQLHSTMSYLTWNGSHAAGMSQKLSNEGFKRVPNDDVPHMTFKAYSQIAHLEPETIDLISSCKEYPCPPYVMDPRMYEPLDRRHSLQTQNLALYRRADPELGVVRYLVRAARDLPKATPLCFVGGQLMESWKCEEHLMASDGYAMTPHELHDYFDYPRATGPPLVLLTNLHHNITKYIRDPSYRSSGEGPNVGTDLILYKKGRIFLVIIYTLCDIAKDEEIYCHRFLGVDSRKGDHQNMVLAARVAHFYHRWSHRLEQMALANGLQLEEPHMRAKEAAAKKQRKLLTQQEMRMHMRGVDPKQKSVPIPPPLTAEEETMMMMLNNFAGNATEQLLWSNESKKKRKTPLLNADGEIDVNALRNDSRLLAFFRTFHPSKSNEETQVQFQSLDDASILVYHHRLAEKERKEEERGERAWARFKAFCAQAEEQQRAAASINKHAIMATVVDAVAISGDTIVDPAVMTNNAKAEAVQEASHVAASVSSTADGVAPATITSPQLAAQSKEHSGSQKDGAHAEDGDGDLDMAAADAANDNDDATPSPSTTDSTSSPSNTAAVVPISSPSPSATPSPDPPSISSAASSSSSSSSSSSAAAAAAAPSSTSSTSNESAIERDMMELIPLSETFRLTGCQQIAISVSGPSLSEETLQLMLKVPRTIYPSVIVIDGDKYPFDAVKMDRMLDEQLGYDADLLEVREIRSLRSPCRYFCPPWYRSFAVVSKQPIQRAELLCLYAGEMDEEVQHRCSAYVYNLPAGEGISQFANDYKGMPDLVVDAQVKGNISRFINDNMFRNGEYMDENAANIGVTWIFASKPHLVFYAKKPIGKGEELISSYGTEFWDVMCRQNLRGQSAYYSYIRAYTTRLERMLHVHNLPLPHKPDVIIERQPRFDLKIGPYEPPPEDSSENEEEEDEEDAELTPAQRRRKRKLALAKKEKARQKQMEIEADETEYSVEKVVGKKYVGRSLLYLIRWLGYSPSDDTWEPLSNLTDSNDAVQLFELRLRQLKLEVTPENPQAKIEPLEQYTNRGVKKATNKKGKRNSNEEEEDEGTKMQEQNGLEEKKENDTDSDVQMLDHPPPAAAVPSSVPSSSSSPASSSSSTPTPSASASASTSTSTSTSTSASMSSRRRLASYQYRSATARPRKIAMRHLSPAQLALAEEREQQQRMEEKKAAVRNMEVERPGAARRMKKRMNGTDANGHTNVNANGNMHESASGNGVSHENGLSSSPPRKRRAPLPSSPARIAAASPADDGDVMPHSSPRTRRNGHGRSTPSSPSKPPSNSSPAAASSTSTSTSTPTRSHNQTSVMTFFNKST